MYLSQSFKRNVHSALGWLIVACMVGCDPPKEVDSSMEMAPPPRAQVIVTPPPPPPPPPPATNYYDPAAAQAALYARLGVSAEFAGDVDAFTRYSVLAETLLPVVEPDGQRLPIVLQEQPVEALRTALHVLSSDDAPLREGARSTLLAVLDRLWARCLRGGVRGGQTTVNQLAATLEQQARNWGAIKSDEAKAVVEWMIANAYAGQPPAAPGAARRGDQIMLASDYYQADAREQAAEAHRQQAWGHVQQGLQSSSQPGDESAAPVLQFRIPGDPTANTPKLALELVNASDVDRTPCILTMSRMSSRGIANDDVLIRHLPAKSAVPIALGTSEDFSTRLAINLQCWDSEGGFSSRRTFRLGRFLKLPPLEQGAAKRTSLVNLLLAEDDAVVNLALQPSGVDPQVHFGVRPAPNRENAWYVLMKKRGEQRTDIVALIELENSELFFTWSPKAPADAEQLAQSMLDVSYGDIARRVFFWQPDVAAPVQLDMNKSEQVLQLEVDDVVDKRSLVLHTLELEDSEVIVAGDASYGRWVEIDFSSVSLAKLKARLFQAKDGPFAITVKLVIDYRGEEGELSAPALEKMYRSNAELATTLPPKIILANQRIDKLQRTLQSLLRTGTATAKAKAIQAEVALNDEVKRRDGLVNALQNAQQRGQWTVKAAEVVKALHQKKLHFMVTTTGENRQLVATSDPQILDGGPMYVLQKENRAQ